MDEQDWYYLYQDGVLSRHKIVRAKKKWRVDPENRFFGWIVAIQALALGANRSDVGKVIQDWDLTNEDGQWFAAYTESELGPKHCFMIQRSGLDEFMAAFGDFQHPAQDSVGEGRTTVDAFANLVKLEPERGHLMLQRLAIPHSQDS